LEGRLASVIKHFCPYVLVAMCGIFAYIGNKQVVELLIAALKRLEYRGYDSAGISVHGGPLKMKKKVGKVSNLEAECSNAVAELEGTCGIAHTRWATHGKPSDRNSHPHATADRSIAVVHNGVIENYHALKLGLMEKGYSFQSETDTEVLVILAQDLRKQMPDATWAQIVASLLQITTGAYGLVFLFQDEPDLMIGARKGSPLLLGIGEGENMLASDASAIIEHTKDVVYIREGELVEVRRDEYKVINIEGIVKSMTEGIEAGSVENPIVHLEMSLEQIEKGGFPHFMMKEIMDQPNSLRNAMRGRLYQQQGMWNIKLGGLEKALEDDQEGRSALERLAVADRIIICACGTSWHSALIGKFALEHFAQSSVEVEYASEFRYRRPLISSQDVVIAISQSGETADTLEAIRVAKEYKALTIGIVNAVGSTIARDTAAGMYLHAGPEIGVASTKAFTCQVAALLMLALRLGHHLEVLSAEAMDEYCGAFAKLPALVEEWMPSLSENIPIIAKYFRLATNALFCGTGVHFPSALEGALKLKEISYIHAEGFPGSEIKHGAYTLVRNFIPIVMIAMRSDPAYEQILLSAKDVQAKRAALIVLTDEGNDDFVGIANFLIHCPATMMPFEPIIAAVPMQLLSYFIADMRGCSIDQPRNLAKSVTVE